MLCSLLALLLSPGCKTEPATPATPATPVAPVTPVNPAPAPSLDPAKYKVQAKEAGAIAALGYLVAENPTVDQAKAISVVLGQISNACKNYPDKGFSSLLPGINAEIDKLLPLPDKKAENLLAKKLAEVLLSELDNQFKRHPEWKMVTAPVVEIVGAFVDGGKKSFDDYLATPESGRKALKAKLPVK